MKRTVLIFLLIVLGLGRGMCQSPTPVVSDAPASSSSVNKTFLQRFAAILRGHGKPIKNENSLAGLDNVSIPNPMLPSAPLPLNEADTATSPYVDDAGNIKPSSTFTNPSLFHTASSLIQNTKNNLSLYVAALQCQSVGINTNNCDQQGTSNTNQTAIGGMNKFLFDSVTSELGIGVKASF